MQGLLSVWASLSARRRIFVVVATVLMFAAVMLVARGASQRDMTLLFGGLDPASAGEVITALDQRGAVYEVRGPAIYVAAEQRDMLRMSLAGEGLPAMSIKGYELLDGLSGFGTTSQMFDAAYWRAREGELARTILASPSVRAARVHISSPSGRPFQRSLAPTAAVTITTAGSSLTAAQIKAFQYLVAAAVSGLSPDDVAVIDDAGGLLSDSSATAAGGQNDTRADLLRDRAERLLLARVGPGNAVVEVSIETVTQSESITETTVDPESRIAISTDVTETSATSQDSRNNAVTVASNVPDGDAADGGGTAANENSETRALTNYEISQTQRQIIKTPGAVRRLTVAVLVNETAAVDGTVTPRSAEELSDLTELVSAAVGLNPERGDVLTLRSMTFGPQPDLGTAAVAPGLLSKPLNIMQLIQLGVAAIVALILGLFVVRPILSSQSAAAISGPPSADRIPQLADDTSIVEGSFAASGEPDTPALPGAGDAVARLRKMIAARETETVQILQDWIETSEKEGT